MWKAYWLTVSAILTAFLWGCGQSPATKQSAAGDQGEASAAVAAAPLDGPAAAAQEFLEALRTGNDAKATTLLSTVARQKTASLNRNVTPPASDTAKFSIGKVDYVGDDGARVACAWTDLDEEGHPQTDKAIWLLRREPDGWRVAGVAAQFFPGEEPLILNFEDPEDMLRKQQWVREEIRRRIETGGLQAQNIEKQEKSLR